MDHPPIHPAGGWTPYPDPLGRRLFCCTYCGKQYLFRQHVLTHEREACSSSKQCLSDLLNQTKLHWGSRKRKREEDSEHPEYRESQEPMGHELIAARTLAGRSASTMQRQYDERDDMPESLQYSSLAQARISENLALHEKSDAVAADIGSMTSPASPYHPPAPLVQESMPVLNTLSQPLVTEGAIDSNRAVTVSRTSGESRAAPHETTPSPLFLYESNPNLFRVVRRYVLPGDNATMPDPEDIVPCASSTLPSDSGSTYGPFANRTAFLLAEWYWGSATKSLSDFQKLISVFKDAEFSVDNAINFNWRTEFQSLGANRDDDRRDTAWISDDGWKTHTISIDIPFHNRMKDKGVKAYTVGEFRYRSIVSIIKEKLSSPTGSRSFQYYPYRATWKRSLDSPEVNLYGELYTSNAFREAHETLQRQPSTQHSARLERVIVALMFWSDSTHLTAFGGASLWPCYLFFGNESKYDRGQPSKNLGHQIAYFMKLPDRLNDFLKDRNKGKLPADGLSAYCARELFHKQWSVLLGPDLVEAMESGIVVSCPDGKDRCFFPRIFTYSADYPEKTLVCGIKNNGTHPCHRCLIETASIYKLGSPEDTERINKQRTLAEQDALVSKAQDSIDSGYAVNSKTFMNDLSTQSLLPVKSGFSRCLSKFTFDIGAALAVDILHEFENGTWRRLFIHLIRLLVAFTDKKDRNYISLCAELNARYRAMPAFGGDTIRKFPLNASELKRRAARDMEDLLQCAIPAFEGLLPEPYNQRLMCLLFVCAQWHALAKLRQHNDFTLSLLDYTTTHLGAEMRKFDRDVCSKVPTKELPKEAEARARKAAREGNGSVSSTLRTAKLGMYTIKFHFLGDYSSTIRWFGTTDSYSTQTGELYHRQPKSWYPRTDKKDYELQLTHIERRRARLTEIRAHIDGTTAHSKAVEVPESASEMGESQTHSPVVPSIARKPELQKGGPATSPLDCRYTMAMNQNDPINLQTLATKSDGVNRNEYLVEFIPGVKQHLLKRLLGQLGPHTSSSAELLDWAHVAIRDNRIYKHKLLRVNFTTYDVRHGQDVLHIDTPQCNIMLLNGRYAPQTRHSEHAYIYGKVLGIYHANVSYAGPLPHGMQRPNYHRIDFAWVQWYQFLGAGNEFSLDRVRALPVSSGSGLGFVDPADIIRGIHLLPQFSQGKLVDLPVRSQFVRGQDKWNTFFINRFVDRDMFMRYQFGMSVGHAYMQSPAFPPAHIPSIPAGFDHGLDVTLPIPRAGFRRGGQAAMNSDNEQPSTSGPAEQTRTSGPIEQAISDPGGAASDSEGTMRRHANERLDETLASHLKLPPVDGGNEVGGGREDLEDQNDVNEDDLLEQESEGEEEEYLGDLDDRELKAYQEMYDEDYVDDRWS